MVSPCVRATWEMYFEGLCMCMCVFCACATIPSEIQSCDVPLIYTIPPNTPTEYLYWFLCYFYKINNSAPSDIKTALIFFFYYVELQWTKCTFYFTHSLGQSHTPFARTLNGAWKYGFDCANVSFCVEHIISPVASTRTREEKSWRDGDTDPEKGLQPENKLVRYWWFVGVVC